MYDTQGCNTSLDSLLKGDISTVWKTSLSNKLGQIAQGIGDISGNDVVDYIKKSDVPADRIVKYANFICDFRPLKSDPHRVRLTVGGDNLPYPDNAASPATSLLKSNFSK